MVRLEEIVRDMATPRDGHTRTIQHVFSFRQDDFEAMNAMALDRACPKSMRAPPLVIGVAGGTASGKTTVCHKIAETMADDRVVIISMDNFYRPLTAEERESVDEFNFDHPDAFDVVEISRCLDSLKRGQETTIPVYDFTTHSRSSEVQTVKPAEVILFEGILVLHVQQIVDRLNMKIYVDTDDDLRLSRRILRDIEARGRDLQGVIAQYTRFVKPAQDRFVTPSRRIADVIIPWHDRDNRMAVELVTEHLKEKLKQHPLVRQYPNLHCMESTPILRHMHTVIRSTRTSRPDFVFYADRLIRLVVEAGLGFLPFGEKCVTTPEGYQYVGVDFARSLCGVSIIRGGEAMEGALRECCQGIKIGKILVYREPELLGASSTELPGVSSPESSLVAQVSALPQPVDDAEANIQNTTVQADRQPLMYCKLPSDVANRHCLLMDSILSSGYTVVRAIEMLLEKGCAEDKIYLLCLIAAPQGLHAVCQRFPGIRVVVSEIDWGLNEAHVVVPGIGEFGNRYFSE